MTIDEAAIYDAVIVGGGMAGLVAAYMLRDQNVLLLERTARFGGKVETVTIGDTTLNIGTQFFGEADTAFLRLIDELGVERTSHVSGSSPYALHMDGQLRDGFGYLLRPRALFHGLRLLSAMYRSTNTLKLPSDDPRWREIMTTTLAELQEGYPPEVLGPVNTYMRGACVAKPTRTAGGVGALMMLDVIAELSFAIGGTQAITDALARRIGDRAVSEAEVFEVVDHGETVTTRFLHDGADRVVNSRAVVMATPPAAVVQTVANLPDATRDGLEAIKWGPIIVVSVFLDPAFTWPRWVGILSDDAIFPGVIDATYDQDLGPDEPVIYNCFVSVPPDETDLIHDLAAKSDDEIAGLVLADLGRVLSGHDVDAFVRDTMVTRYPLGELELSPEYYLEILPHLEQPIGNIHLCGDYTHRLSFLDGAAHSGFRAARALGSEHVLSEDEEIALPEVPRWGRFGLASLATASAVGVGGAVLAGAAGIVIVAAAALLFGLTAAWPSILPPNQGVYRALLGASVVVGVVAAGIGLAT
ncbi:MAG: NAD(P)/FAD-dependent oxidoreductase [Acidimicrobiales bacterium]|jgi:protoporphyrinogen oxidase|nr:NAD(P)/FAD-dependent oxidoreductase [Acidimicrobiales bacterium]MDP6649596.1 NAD(P)/FAD-dependent oxidoreductase [Acidimicrobiales bacterium]MDP6759080.1 NAD(P)/FAD-dependent oxidoreductase [Acidimicrobiales bacterium]|tara:strand:- start:420 stop:2003 length:1584 start_codon:yes stop_codon:yes gene_type:complete